MSSAMSESATLSILCVKPVPGPLVTLVTMFAPTSRSVLDVVIGPDELKVPEPPDPAAISNGLVGFHCIPESYIWIDGRSTKCYSHRI
jgi:hypothetical protein